MRSAKNKTLNLSEEQERKYLALCPKKYVSDDCVIKGDCMEIMWDIPHSSVDLMIVDRQRRIFATIDGGVRKVYALLD